MRLTAPGAGRMAHGETLNAHRTTRRLGGTLALAAALLCFGAGLPLVAAANDSETTTRRVDLGQDVEFVPADGWTTRQRGPLDASAAEHRGVSLAAEAFPTTASLEREAAALERTVVDQAGVQVTAESAPVVSRDGATGLRASFQTDERRGEYAVFVRDGTAVRIVVAGPDAAMRSAGDDIDAMVRSVRFRGGP